MTIKYYPELVQSTDEWRAARCGILTASEMSRIITPAKLQYAQNEKEKTHLLELAAQRINNYVEPTFLGFDMERGKMDELDAKLIYNKEYALLTDVGFITNDKWGFTLGYSPDALVGEEGAIEVKSRVQKYQLETILADEMPDEFKIQVQTGLLVSERAWCDFITYCGGMKMFTKRVFADQKIQDAIVAAAKTFHERLDAVLKLYQERISASGARFMPTERVEREMHL